MVNLVAELVAVRPPQTYRESETKTRSESGSETLELTYISYFLLEPFISPQNNKSYLYPR